MNLLKVSQQNSGTMMDNSYNSITPSKDQQAMLRTRG